MFPVAQLFPDNNNMIHRGNKTVQRCVSLLELFLLIVFLSLSTSFVSFAFFFAPFNVILLLRCVHQIHIQSVLLLLLFLHGCFYSMTTTRNDFFCVKWDEDTRDMRWDKEYMSRTLHHTLLFPIWWSNRRERCLQTLDMRSSRMLLLMLTVRGKSIWWWKRREGRVMTVSKTKKSRGGCEVQSWVDDCLPLDYLLFQSLLLFFISSAIRSFWTTWVSRYQDVLTYSVHAFNYVNPYSKLMFLHICSRDYWEGVTWCRSMRIMKFSLVAKSWMHYFIHKDNRLRSLESNREAGNEAKGKWDRVNERGFPSSMTLSWKTMAWQSSLWRDRRKRMSFYEVTQLTSFSCPLSPFLTWTGEKSHTRSFETWNH